MIKDRRFIIPLIIFIVLIAISCSFPILFTRYSIVSFSQTGQIGDTIGGIMSPFVAIIASALTFLAFWVQYEANQEQRLQFNTQSQDQLFFRLIDAQESKIINSSFKIGDREISSFQVTEIIVKEFLKQLKTESRSLARQVVRNQFETLEGLYYQKMFEANGIPPHLWDSEKERFIANMRRLNTNERWEYIKTYFGSLYYESEEQTNVLETIGGVYFYRIGFEEREYSYSIAYQHVEKEFGSFLDGYFKGAEFIAEIIENSKNEKIYIQYYVSQLTKFEKLLLFYYVAGGKRSANYVSFANTYNLFSDIHQYSNLLIDSPDRDQITEELKLIFASQR